MKKRLTFLTTTSLLIFTAPAMTVLFEDFEDSAITYTTSIPDDLSDIGSRDYFGRIAPDTALPPVDISYVNPLGSGYYGAQDTDGANSGDVQSIELNWVGIDITNFTNLNLSWFVGEDDSTDGNQDWDSTSSLRLSIQLDGGGFSQIFGIESELVGGVDQTNERPLVDTDFDGIGDGTEITNVMTQFSSALVDGGTLDIRLVIQDLDTGDEDIAFDNLLLTGDAVPEPGSVALIGLAGLYAGLRRRC